jgi:transcription initiation factor TFIIIB Brf1 subunit/transcription initiation factor TFIIB
MVPKSHKINETEEKIVIKKLSDNTSKLGIPEDVITEASKILAELSLKTKRSKKKNLLDFYCIYKAYENLGIKRDTQSLGILMNLNTKEINTALGTYSSIYDNKGIVKNISAIDLVDEYCKKVGFQNKNQELYDLTLKILKTQKDLADENPRKLICTIIKYYMTINGINYDKAIFKEKLGFSIATLNILYKKISSLALN